MFYQINEFEFVSKNKNISLLIITYKLVKYAWNKYTV